MKVYQALAWKLQAIKNCETVLKSCEFDNPACNRCIKAQYWIAKHQEDIDDIMSTAPRGSGFDCGTTLEQIELYSTPNKLVFKTEYHHMNDAGFYDGWTSHKVIITPDLADRYNIKVTGKNRSDIKDYIADVFGTWVCEEVNE